MAKYDFQEIETIANNDGAGATVTLSAMTIALLLSLLADCQLWQFSYNGEKPTATQLDTIDAAIATAAAELIP